MRSASQIATLSGLAFALVALSVHPASATYVCTVQESPDGFVAVRAKPSADSELIAKASADDAIVIQQNDNGDLIEDGIWVNVYHFPGDVVPDTSDPDYAKGHIGWMPRSFVNDCG